MYCNSTLSGRKNAYIEITGMTTGVLTETNYSVYCFRNYWYHVFHVNNNNSHSLVIIMIQI